MVFPADHGDRELQGTDQGTDGSTSVSTALWSGVWTTANATVAGTRDEGRPVRSLDQLYSQAFALDPTLGAYCAAWAADSGGQVAPYSARAATACAVADVVGHLKPTGRAVSKAALCYAGDVSRVVDICRRRLLFSSGADLLTCLRLIVAETAAAQRHEGVFNAVAFVARIPVGTWKVLDVRDRLSWTAESEKGAAWVYRLKFHIILICIYSPLCLNQMSGNIVIFH